ncbi:MAG: sigma-70 family RNA polymerase sigma factor [Clostridia bacterium]|nr:sigma-70 family RNA polymerase sigma factor [Clostridia bacterium]MBQ6868719.1 sigma-70 family RNA polymerase sigma factor [Clostridia bacterium]MBQ7093719.1 sigma-70 family RNA polymerase sigma factor [Clostridia bacterium]
MVNEKEIIRRAANGDMEAFEIIVSLYEKKVYNLAYRNLGNEQDALDACQEVFLRVFRFMGKFKEESSFSTWIYSIAMNVCRDHIKRSRIGYDVSLNQENDDEEYEIEVSDIRYNPENAYERKELSEKLESGMRQLSSTHRDVLVLREVAGKSYAEISEILSLDVGTVKSRIARARENLRKYLSDHGTFLK